MARYRIVDRGVHDTVTGRDVPPDPSNPDWQAYLAWFAAGNWPDDKLIEPDPPPNLREFYRQAGAARTERQLARLSNDEWVETMRKRSRR